ncbi:unnamed protein product, partial [Larinioides sclopetarius]
MGYTPTKDIVYKYFSAASWNNYKSCEGPDLTSLRGHCLSP